MDWDALATRIARALPARAALTWWSYAERWSRRIAADRRSRRAWSAPSMLWNADEPRAVVVAQAAPADVVADVVQGAPVEDAARTLRAHDHGRRDVLAAAEPE